MQVLLEAKPRGTLFLAVEQATDLQGSKALGGRCTASSKMEVQSMFYLGNREGISLDCSPLLFGFQNEITYFFFFTGHVEPMIDSWIERALLRGSVSYTHLTLPTN